MPEALTEERVAGFRQQICDVAINQFAKNGLDKVSMRSIARELGYSATALYSYYRNKDDILSAARAVTLNRLDAELQRALDSSSDADKSCRNFIKTYLGFAQTNRPGYQLVFALDQPAPENYPHLEKAIHCIHHHFAEYARKSLATTELPLDSRLANLVWSQLHGFTSLIMSGIASAGNTASEELYQSISHMLLQYPGSNEEPPKRGEQMAFQL